MTNDDRLNAESDLYPNKNYNKLCLNYERHYKQLNYNADLRVKRRCQVESNQHKAQIISK